MKKHSKNSDILSIIKKNLIYIFIPIVAGIILLNIEYHVFNKLDKIQTKDFEFQDQIKSLNDVEASLKGLISFVESQRAKLSESQRILNALNEEESKLRPIVEADRKVVETIFELQAKKAEATVWRERVVGFTVGVISSVIASIIYSFVGSILKKSKKNTQIPEKADPDS